MPKIIYLIEQPFDERNFKRFGIQFWIETGWSVEVWNFTQLSFPKVWEEFKSSGCNTSNFKGLQDISNLGSLRKKLRKSKSVNLCIDFTGWNFYTIYAKLQLKLKGVKLIHLLNGALPSVKLRESRKKSQLLGLLDLIKFKSISKIAHKILYKISSHVLKPDYIVVTGSQQLNFSEGETSVICAHDFDYDVYLGIRSNSNEDNLITNTSCVFLDQNLTQHTDFLGMNKDYPVTSENYFKKMSLVFSKLTNEIELPIYIAEHPRSLSTPNWTNVDKIMRGSTAMLVKKSRAVICHYSTSVKFAVLFNKPILFFTTNELNQSGYGKLIEQIAFELGKSVINIDNDLDGVNWDSELRIDDDKYKTFIEKYIKFPGTPEKPLWVIIINHFHS